MDRFTIYFDDITVAVLTFPFVAAVLSLPYAIYQYRRYGAVPLWKTFVVFAFVLYCLCAYFLVILPLPADHSAIVPYAQTPQLDPMNVVRQLKEAAASVGLSLGNRHSWIAFAKCSCVYQAVFNVALTVPLGMFLQYFLKRPLWQTLILGFAATLFFELSQYTGLWGIYEHPYRLFDVDDLILNTMGAVVGWIISVPISAILPDIDAMNERARYRGTHYTTFARRALSFTIDLLLSNALVSLLLLAFGDGGTLDAEGLMGRLDLLYILGATGVVFMLVPALTMRTPGQALLGLRIVRPDGSRPAWWGPVVRYGILVWLWIVIIPWSVMLYQGNIEGVSVSKLATVAAMMYALWALTLVVRALVSAFKHTFVTLPGLVSDTRIMASAVADNLNRQRAESVYSMQVEQDASAYQRGNANYHAKR